METPISLAWQASSVSPRCMRCLADRFGARSSLADERCWSVGSKRTANCRELFPRKNFRIPQRILYIIYKIFNFRFWLPMSLRPFCFFAKTSGGVVVVGLHRSALCRHGSDVDSKTRQRSFRCLPNMTCKANSGR